MTNNIIEVHNLSKNYQVTNRSNGTLGAIKSLFKPDKRVIRAVKSLEFSISAGESVGFIGQNGAGKTTTIKMLTGTLFPSSGYSVVNGFDPIERKKEFKKSIAVVMGNRSQLFPDLTPRDYLQLLKSIYEIDGKVFESTVARIAKLLKIENKLDVQTRKLSLGERMKVEFLAGVVIQPKILFLDEPTIGLDVIAKRDIRKFIVQLNREEGIMIFLTSHDMEDISTICNRLIIVNKGSIIWDGETDKLLNKFGRDKYISFTKSEFFEISKINQKVIDQDQATITIKVPKNEVDKTLSYLNKEQEGSNFKIHNLKLDDVIFELFSKGY